MKKKEEEKVRKETGTQPCYIVCLRFFFIFRLFSYLGCFVVLILYIF